MNIWVHWTFSNMLLFTLNSWHCILVIVTFTYFPTYIHLELKWVYSRKHDQYGMTDDKNCHRVWEAVNCRSGGTIQRSQFMSLNWMKSCFRKHGSKIFTYENARYSTSTFKKDREMYLPTMTSALISKLLLKKHKWEIEICFVVLKVLPYVLRTFLKAFSSRSLIDLFTSKVGLLDLRKIRV